MLLYKWTCIYILVLSLLTFSLAEAQEAASDTGVKDAPTGSIKGSELFGRESTFFHFGVTVTQFFTDNAYLTQTKKESGYGTTVSPEIWISLPAAADKLRDFESTSTVAPGGLELDRIKANQQARYHSILMYRADIPVAGSNTSVNTSTTHTILGGFSYMFGGGLGLELRDQYSISSEFIPSGITDVKGSSYKYHSNMAGADATYEFSDRFAFRGELSNYLLDFSDAVQSYRNRSDYGFSAYVYYRLMSRTAFFLEYSRSNISYAETSSLDSSEQFLYGGFTWSLTSKSKGMIKAGYEIKKFTESSKGSKNLSFETQVDYRFTPKTSLSLAAYRKTNETDMSGAAFMLTDSVSLQYQQMLTAKITGLAGLQYVRNAYDGTVAYEGVSGRRTDNTVQATIGLQYAFRKKLRAALGYTFTDRNSTFAGFDYRSNSGYLRLTAEH